MAYVEVRAASADAGRIQSMRVHMAHLPERTIDRDTAIRWMRDGHSLVPVVNGARTSALQLVEVGEEPSWYIRTDNATDASDSLPASLPAS